MSTKIYLVRHGEVYNPDGIIYGRLPNFGLSEKGKKEIEQTADFLSDKHIDAIYSSPLERARQTADIIKDKLGITNVHTSNQLLEVKTSYQGGKFKDLDSLQSEVYLKPLSPNDETIEQIAYRMLTCIENTLEEQKGKHIVMCSHGDPIMIVKTAIQKKELTFNTFKTNIYIQHGEVYEVIADEKNDLSIKNVFAPHV
jgi:broad specificity phosphatase PhoE